MQPAPAATRPYWHVDLKWICGILFTFVLVGALLAAALTTLTRREVAVPVGASVLKNVLISFSERSEEHSEGEILNEEQKKQQFIEELRAQPGDPVQPIPHQPATLTRVELETLPADQLVDLLFYRLAENYYVLGVDGVIAQQNLSPQEAEQARNQASLLRLINQDTHELLNNLRIWLMVLALLPLIGLVYFSHGAGRLVSPGLVLFFVGLPGTLITAIITYIPKGDRAESPIPFLSPELATEVGRSLFATFAAASISGLILLVGAVIVGLLRRHHGQPTAHEPTEKNRSHTSGT